MDHIKYLLSHSESTVHLSKECSYLLFFILFIYLLTCGLFNDAISISDYKASDDMMMNNELEIYGSCCSLL
jgi:hypothetical protein